jgi:hypothetical protein
MSANRNQKNSTQTASGIAVVRIYEKECEDESPTDIKKPPRGGFKIFT